MPWVAEPTNWTSIGSFLTKIDTENGPALGLVSVSVVRVGDKNLFVVGGERLGKEFLASLVFPAGMRALLYLNLSPEFQPAGLLDESGAASQPERLAPILGAMLQQSSGRASGQAGGAGDQSFKILWTPNRASAEEFHALPLLGRGRELLGVLLVGSSQREVVILENRIIGLASIVAAAGLLLGLLLSWWSAARVTRPVRKLAEGAREVSEGNWNARVNVRGRDEIGQLAATFNRMTEQLTEQRDRLVQAERVAAWREVARRLAHELKNPLFPLQTTVENLQRAKEQSPEQFEEVFRESTGILISEIENLKAIVGRFSDFAKMPEPELAPVNLNDLLRGVVKVFEAQFGAVGRPPITPEMHLEENPPSIQADSVLLRRAVENLILNAMDAMPSGGVLMLRTTHDGEDVRLGDRRYRDRADDRGVQPAVHAVLHHEAARHGPRPRHRAVRDQRPRGTDIRGERNGHRHHISHQPSYHRGGRESRGRSAGSLLPAMGLTAPAGKWNGGDAGDSGERRSVTRMSPNSNASGNGAMAAKAHILIIDDDANTLASLARAFRLAGHEATVCDNAARALELAKAQRFDLILSDVVMPGKDGIALLEDFRSIGVASPIVMMSGQATIEMAVKATRLGATDFLEKPVSTEKLLLAVENALRMTHLEEENRELKRRLGRHHIVWASGAMREVMAMVEQVAASETRVCVRGETGTGKELIARTLHEKSSRRNGPFISLNCAAIPAELMESELFGHEKGSFTGAASRHVGKFEQAHRGTLFLDEIGDMPIAMQAKLLRVLEEGEIERVGGDRPISLDVRVVVATHRNLEEQVRHGTFREDLYHRVYVFPIVIPPLRKA